MEKRREIAESIPPGPGNPEGPLARFGEMMIRLTEYGDRVIPPILHSIGQKVVEVYDFFANRQIKRD